jgi:hypothetical protein
MSFFGEKKQISVASTAYNMAGPEIDRPDFLKTTVIGKITAQPNAQSLGDHIVTTYLNGPGMRLRGWARWARLNGYSDKIQLEPSRLSISAQDNLNFGIIAAEIPGIAANQTAVIQRAIIGTADFTWWVDQHVALNYPEQVGLPYESMFDELANVISITFEDGSTTSFTPVGWNPGGIYLYVGYNVSTGRQEQPVEPGEPETLDPADPWPETDGWDEQQFIETPSTVTLNTTVHTEITWSDTTPGSESTVITPRDEDYDALDAIYTKTEFKGNHPTEQGVIYELFSEMTWNQTHEIDEVVETEVITETVGSATKTTTITTTTEVLKLVRTVQIDTQEIWLGGLGPVRVFIYQRGSGNPTLDAQFTTGTDFGEMFPFIPIRIWNRFIGPSFHPEYWDWTQRAYRRVMRQRIDKVIETLEDNKDLKDIDFAYVMFGVALNTKESASLRYLYEFFQEIMIGQDMNSGLIADWATANAAAEASVTAFQQWSEAQSDPENPLFGTPAPEILPFPPPPTYGINLRGATDLNFNVTVSWTGIDEDSGSGLLKPDAKPGDLWIVKGGEFTFPQNIYNNGAVIPGEPINSDQITILWQVDQNLWRKLDIYGLVHTNLIYGGRAVTITAHEALNDPDDTGFIIPLHEQIYRRVAIVPKTQASTACCYMVLNSYTVRKQKWYETDAFKILLIVVVIVITIVSAGAAGPAGAGILGANAAIGAALGFTGTAAIIVGAIANAVAAMLISQIISYVSTAVFGPKVGAIVGVIASLIAMQVGTAYFSGSSFVDAVGSLMEPGNLARLTAAASDGAASFIRAQTQETILEAQTTLARLSEEIADVETRREEMLGGDIRGMLDPLTLANVTYAPITESPQTFLTRTLLTGSDMAEMSHDLISGFADLTTQNLLPGNT